MARRCVGPLLVVALLVLAGAVVPATSFARTGPYTWKVGTDISIPAAPLESTFGKAGPYPDTIDVHGFTGEIIKLTVTLYTVSHTYPADMDILLVGPSTRLRAGRGVVLMSDAGAGADIHNIRLTFDDDAAGPLPNSPARGSTITTGTYTPTNYEGDSDTFPSPAPAGPYAATLSTFNGLSPNGAWKLYAYDDRSGDVGDINNGWSLTFTIERPPVIDPLEDQTTAEGQLLNIDFAAEDDDADPLQASVTGPTFVSIHYFSGYSGFYDGRLRVRPDPGDAGSYPVSLTVTDGMRSVTETFTLTVTDATRPATGAALDPPPTAAGWNTSAVTVTLSATDPQGGASGVANITYSADGAQPIPMTTVAGATASFLIDVAGDTTVSFAATDNAGNVEITQTQLVRIDLTAPTSSHAIAGTNAAGWNNADVTVTLSATDDAGGSGAESITYSATGAQPISSTTVSGSSAAVVITSEGDTTLTYFATDRAGNTEAAHTRVIRLDKTAPTVTPPAARLRTGQQIGNNTLPVTLSWVSNDTLSGVRSHQLQGSVDGGGFTNTILPSPTSVSVTRLLAVDSTFRYRVRATDVAGNLSAFALGTVFTPDLHQELDTAITYTGIWPRASVTGTSGGAVKHSATAGNTATFTFVGRSVIWVAVVGSDRGKAVVRLDNQTPRIVDLYAPTLQGKHIVFAANNLDPSITHTLTIRVHNTRNAASSGFRVDVDAFGVLR